MFVSGIDEVNGPTQDDSSNKCNRESDAVVRMKFQLSAIQTKTPADAARAQPTIVDWEPENSCSPNTKSPAPNGQMSENAEFASD